MSNWDISSCLDLLVLVYVMFGSTGIGVCHVWIHWYWCLSYLDLPVLVYVMFGSTGIGLCHVWIYWYWCMSCLYLLVLMYVISGCIGVGVCHRMVTFAETGLSQNMITNFFYLNEEDVNQLIQSSISPDLNSIEDSLDEFGHAVKRVDLFNQQNLRELEQTFIRKWNVITQHRLDQLGH